jgi:hypothetical protein
MGNDGSVANNRASKSSRAHDLKWPSSGSPARGISVSQDTGSKLMRL